MDKSGKGEISLLNKAQWDNGWEDSLQASHSG